jgi:hypothetical protein
MKESRAYLKSENLPWPNGYGVGKTFEQLDVKSIPEFWVVDRQNRIVAHIQGWSSTLGEELERALILALNSSAVGIP